MASLFGGLFGQPQEGGGLFSASNTFRRKAEDSGIKTRANYIKMLAGPIDAANEKQSEREQKPKKRGKDDARRSKKGTRSGAVSVTDDTLQSGKVMGQAEQAVIQKDKKEKTEKKTRKASGLVEEATVIDASTAGNAPGTSKKKKKGSKSLESKEELEEKWIQKESNGDVEVVHKAGKPRRKAAIVDHKVDTNGPASKRQRVSQNGNGTIHLADYKKDNVSKPTTKLVRTVLNAEDAGAGSGAKVEYNDALELLALKQRAEQVRLKRGRAEEGEEPPVKHVVELEDATDKAPTKKKKAKLTEDSDDEKLEKIVEKRQAAKKRKRSEKDKLPRTIFVGNLPPAVKSKELKKEFAQFGDIESVRLRSLSLEDSKMPRKAAVLAGKVSDVKDSVNAYVVFEDAESAQKALAHNMQEFLGRHLRVDLAAPVRGVGAGPPVEYDRLLSLFVGNLPFDVKDEEVIQAFAGAAAPEELQGSVEAVRVVRDKTTGLGKGIAYVMFKSKAASKVAIASTIKVRDRQVRLTRPGAKLKARTKLTTSSGKSRTVSTAKHTPQWQTAPAATKQKGRASWEGSYAKKADGKPGKGGGRLETVRAPRGDGTRPGGVKGKKGPKGVGEQPENRKRAGKRPSVAARKAKAGSAAVAASPLGGVAKVGKKPVRPSKVGAARKADKKKASKGTESFQVKGRKQ